MKRTQYKGSSTMKKYQIIYADPPWEYTSKQPFRSNGVRFNSLSNEYKTMKMKDLYKLNIQNITDGNCILFMWATDSHIKEAIKLMEER